MGTLVGASKRTTTVTRPPPGTPVADPERRRRRHTEEVGLVTGKIDENRGVAGMGVAERERSGHD